MPLSSSRAAVLALTATLLSFAAPPAHAQGAAPSAADAGVCTRPPASATREAVRISLGVQPLTAAGMPLASLSRAQREALDQIARELRSKLLRLRAPYVGSLKGRFIGVDSARPFVAIDLSSQLLVTVGPDGVISAVGTEGPASFANPAEEQELMQLVRNLSEKPEMRRLVTALRDGRDSNVRLRVFTTGVRAAPPKDAPWVQHLMHEGETPTFSATLARIKPDQPFPSVEGLRGLTDRERVLLEYHIGADGRAIPSSVRVLLATNAELATLYRRWIPTVQFVPATIGGCPVATLDRQWVRFSIQR